MKVNYQNNRDTSFNGFLNNKFLKKSLEFAAENGTLFGATATLALSGIRPLAILATPKTDKNNKKVASAKSVTSSINGYLIALICSLPMSRAIKKIDKNPEKYISKDAIKELKGNCKTLTDSKAYIMGTQLFKLGVGFIIAAPKAFLTALGTPFILNSFKSSQIKKEISDSEDVNNLAFKGKDKYPKKLGEIFNNKKFQGFVKKYADTNFPLHIIAATDSLATATFIQQIAQSKKMDEKDKRPLIYNSILSTALSIISTYTIDKITEKQTDKFIEKYKKINANDPNVKKQAEGIRIAKPILIAGCIYYILIPVISTFWADRIKFTGEKKLFFNK